MSGIPVPPTLNVPRWAWYVVAAFLFLGLLKYVSCTSERRGRDQAQAHAADSVSRAFLEREKLRTRQDSLHTVQDAQQAHREDVWRSRAGSLASLLDQSRTRQDSLRRVLLAPRAVVDSGAVQGLVAITDSLRVGYLASQQALAICDSLSTNRGLLAEALKARLAEADSLVSQDAAVIRSLKLRRPPLLPWAIAVLAVVVAILK